MGETVDQWVSAGVLQDFLNEYMGDGNMTAVGVSYQLSEEGHVHPP